MSSPSARTCARVLPRTEFADDASLSMHRKHQGVRRCDDGVLDMAAVPARLRNNGRVALRLPCMTRLGALVRGGVEGVVGTLAMDLLWYPSGLLIRTRPLPQTGIGGKNDHVVDQLGLTYCRKDGLVGVLPAPATLPCSEAS